MFALADNVTPTWDWEQFQNWSTEKKTLVFGAYYDKKYPPLNVSYENVCRLEVERFDHRKSAQEVAYGRWLHNIEPETEAFHDHPKGLLVSIPIHECESSLAQRESNTLPLTISVAGRLGAEPESIEIQIRVGEVGTWLIILGRSFEIS